MALMGKRRSALAGLCVLAFTGQVAAADLVGQPVADYCRVATTSNLVLTENTGELTAEVVRLMDEAVAAANSSEWIELQAAGLCLGLGSQGRLRHGLRLPQDQYPRRGYAQQMRVLP